MADATHRSVTKARDTDRRHLQRAVLDVVDKYLRQAEVGDEDDESSASDRVVERARSHHRPRRYASSPADVDEHSPAPAFHSFSAKAQSSKRPRTRDSYGGGGDLEHDRRSKQRRVERPGIREPASPPTVDSRTIADLGQDLAGVIADAAPAWLDPNSSTLRRLQKGLVRVVADFVAKIGAGGERKHRDVPTSAPPPARRQPRSVTWDAPPLPARAATPPQHRNPSRPISWSASRAYHGPRPSRAHDPPSHDSLRDRDTAANELGVARDDSGSSRAPEYESLVKHAGRSSKSVWDPKPTPPGGTPQGSRSGDSIGLAWTTADDEELRRLKAEGLDWHEIAFRFPGKTPAAAKRRFSKLPVFGGPGPMSRKQHDRMPWSAEDEALLLRLRAAGQRWPAIRPFFPDRTYHSLKGREQLLRARGRPSDGPGHSAGSEAGDGDGVGENEDEQADDDDAENEEDASGGEGPSNLSA